jgi:hypothetical protein
VVLLLHKAVMLAGLRGKTDWLLHLTGGIAIAYFLWTCIPVLEPWFGKLSRVWRLLITLCAGCTVALIWDLAEFASDEILGTDVQHSLRETMLDLTWGALGVTAVIAALAISKKPRSSANPQIVEAPR